VATVLARLEAAGFETGDPRPLGDAGPVDPPGGVTVAHGPSGRQAAEVVAAALAGAGTGADPAAGDQEAATARPSAPAGPAASVVTDLSSVHLVEITGLAPREVVVTVTDPVPATSPDGLGAGLFGPDRALGLDAPADRSEDATVTDDPAGAGSLAAASADAGSCH
ncbi:MAG: hypothetical protein ACK5PP_10150, partial [Acidimicrobiales bacterium]